MIRKIALALLMLFGLMTTTVGAADQYPAIPIRPFSTTTTLTTALLAASGTYTGSWQDSSNGQKFITVTAITAQSGSYVVQFTEDQAQTTYYQSSQTYSVTGGTVTTSPPIFIPTRYFRVVYTNGATAQTGTFELIQTLSQNMMNAFGTYNATSPTLNNGQSTNLQLDQNGNLKTWSFMVGQYNSTLPTLSSGSFSNVQVDSNGRILINCATGCGGAGGGSTTTTTYPSPAPNPSPGATGNPLYSDTHGNLYVAQGPNSPGTSSTTPLYATDPNSNTIAQDSSSNQGVYLAGSGEGSSSSNPMYFTDPNITAANMDASKNLVTVGNGPNSQHYVMQSYQGGMEIEGSTAVSTTAVSISMSNAYYKISLWNTGSSPAYCNLTATATASITGGILLPASMSLPFEIYWKTSGASTVSCITSTGTTTVQAISFR